MEERRVAAQRRGKGAGVRSIRQVGCFFPVCARGKFKEGPGPGLSGDLVEVAGELVSGRCRRGCDAEILCAPPLAACVFLLVLLFYLFYLFYLFLEKILGGAISYFVSSVCCQTYFLGRLPFFFLPPRYFLYVPRPRNKTFAK